VWATYHGKKTTGRCYCCGTSISKKKWHCSHVKADAKGGETNLNNLRTCCPHCNLSMGDQNLYTYMRDKDLRGPGRKNMNSYLKRHNSQKTDWRTNNWSI
jgi:5-methylcytosine-specific restriction endonuclease McrA